jgi:hypothetical protein
MSIMSDISDISQRTCIMIEVSARLSITVQVVRLSSVYSCSKSPPRKRCTLPGTVLVRASRAGVLLRVGIDSAANVIHKRSAAVTFFTVASST